MLIGKRPQAPDIHAEFIIIGAGVVGLTLARSLAERGREVWVLGSPYESQLAKAGPIEEASLPEGTVGLKHIEELMDSAKKAGVNMKSSMVTGVDFSSSPKKVSTKFQTFFGQNVVIATGAKQKRGGFQGESEYYHRGISDCAVCDGNLFRGRTVGVFGNHKYTLKAFRYLSSLADKVYLFWNSPEPPSTGLPEGTPAELIFSNFINFEVYGDDGVSGVRLEVGGERKEIQLDGLFVEGEPVPNSEVFSGELEIRDQRIVVDDAFMTSVEGVFALGDVTGIVSNYDAIVEQVKRFLSLLDEGKI